MNRFLRLTHVCSCCLSSFDTAYILIFLAGTIESDCPFGQSKDSPRGVAMALSTSSTNKRKARHIKSIMRKYVRGEKFKDTKNLLKNLNSFEKKISLIVIRGLSD